ncbi:MAG: hypothetical protein ABSC42_08580 [Tepidisphaeraceae bacterium]|jgi:hypothetical protein
MLYQSFHRLVFPMVTITIIGTVWVVAWSQALTAEADKRFWPALPVPYHVIQSPAQSDGSLQEIFLKHDQVVGMR